MGMKLFARSIVARAAASATLLTALLGGANPAGAAEIRLLSAAAMQTVFKEIVGDFERISGHKVIIHYGTIGAITDWIRGGEEADLVITSPPSLIRFLKNPAVIATIKARGMQPF